MVLLVKFKLNSIEVLISKSLIDSVNSHDGFVLINNVLKEYDNVKEEIKKMHLRQPGFTYSACGAFTNSNERIQKLKETGDSRCTYQKKLDKACFQHDMDYGVFEDLNRETAADKVLCDEAFNFVKNLQYYEYLRGLASIVYIFFDKKISGGTVKTKIISNRELEEELHKPIIRKFNKRKKYTHLLQVKLWRRSGRSAIERI